MPIELAPGTTVYLAPPEPPEIRPAPPSSTVVVVPVEGPPGPTGPEGPIGNGINWYSGEGPPGTVIGAGPGDLYLDTVSGLLYRLN